MKSIITISREFGSGGRTIGKLVAEKLGYRFYDKELVKEVAKRSGVAVSALHFYESKGLITSIRNSGNQRRYKRDALRYVAIIKIAQRIGIPLATIGEAFGVLLEGHTLSAKEWKQLSSQWREELDRRIHTLVALRDELDGCIGCGCLSRSDCPLRNPGDRLGEEGTGARLLEDEQN